MRQLVVSLGGLDKAAITAAKSMSWGTFAKALTTLPPEVASKDARGWYIPATFEGARRHGDHFVHRDALTFDFDHVNIDTWGVAQNAFKDIAYAIYTTFSHTYDAPRFRVVVPLLRSVSADEYEAIARKVAVRVGIELVARESFTSAQMMYLPTRRLGGEFVGEIGKSQTFLDPDAVLKEYDDGLGHTWSDRDLWPRRADEEAPGTGERTDPREKPGIIGEFNRRFTIQEAIARFDLPYKPTTNPDRYTYLKGSVAEGVVIYDDGLKFHSHHDTDPCRGQHNCFDLVRLTRFGSLDDVERDKELGPGDRPSYRAMADFIRQLPEFRPEAADEFVDLRAQQSSAEQDQAGAGDGTGDRGTPGVGATPAEVSDGKPQRFLVREPADFSDGPPLDWIVRGVLPRAELAVVYGESGSGKSFLALDLCAAVGRGVKWRDRDVSRGPSVYVCAEGARGFKTRLRAYARGHNAAIHELPAIIADTPNLTDAAEVGEIYGAILRWGKKPEIIVVDTLSAALGAGDENSGTDMGRVVAHCKLLHRRTGALVVLIHHSGKDASKGARGWSGLKPATDVEVEITRSGDYRTATITKMKDGTDKESFTFKLKVIELDPLNDEPQSSCIIEHIDTPAERPRTKRALNGFPKLVYDTLQVMAPTGTCNIGDLVEGVKKKCPKDDGRDTRRQRVIETLRRTLIPDGYAFMHGEDRIGLTNLLSEDLSGEAREWLNENS